MLADVATALTSQSPATDPRVHARARAGRRPGREPRHGRELRRTSLRAAGRWNRRRPRAGRGAGCRARRRGDREPRRERREDRRALPRALAGRPTCPLTVCSSRRLRRSVEASWPMPSGTTVAAAGWVPSRAHPNQRPRSITRSARVSMGGPRALDSSLPSRQRDRRQIIPAYRSWRAPSRHGTGEAVAREQARRISRGLSRSRLGGGPCGAAARGGRDARSGSRTFDPTGRSVGPRSMPRSHHGHGRLSAGPPGTR